MNPSAPQLTDAQLLDSTRAGDMAAYDELYRRHVPDARRVARVVTDDREEAGDVVAEAFTRVLAKLREGRGPEGVLTPYLRTVVRRLAVDRHRGRSRAGHPADPAMLEELPTADDEIDRATDRQLVRAAFEALPERWQRVLWHTEIEGRPPAALTPALGSSPNAVAALAYRARDGLRQAFLAVHLASTAPPACRPFVPQLAAYIRQALPQEDDVAVGIHLDTCAHCRGRRDELLLLVSDVRGVLAPALLGSAAGGGLAAAAPSGAVLAGAAATADVGTTAGLGAVAAEGSGATKSISGVARLRPRGVVQIVATSVVSAAAAVAVAVAAVSAMSQPNGTDEPAAAPPASSEHQPATVTTPSSVPAPSPETIDTPTDTPAPTDDPDKDEDTTSADTARPAAESPAGRSQDATRADDSPSSEDSSPTEPPTKTVPPEDTPSEPTPKPQSKPEPGDDRDRHSKRDQGNKDRGAPPPSPWICEILPQLPWCD